LQRNGLIGVTLHASRSTKPLRFERWMFLLPHRGHLCSRIL
jgi:hypothetical protein